MMMMMMMMMKNKIPVGVGGDVVVLAAYYFVSFLPRPSSSSLAVLEGMLLYLRVMMTMIY